MEDHGRFLSVVEDKLVDHIEDNRHNNNTGRVIGTTQDLTCEQGSKVHLCREDREKREEQRNRGTCILAIIK